MITMNYLAVADKYNIINVMSVSYWPVYDVLQLLTSKIATLVMDKKRRGVPIPWSCIRDVLYQYAPQVNTQWSLFCIAPWLIIWDNLLKPLFEKKLKLQ